MASTFTKQDFTTGALYRLGAKLSLPRTVVETLLVERAGMKSAAATQLVGHWFTTEPFRKGSN